MKVCPFAISTTERLIRSHHDDVSCDRFIDTDFSFHAVVPTSRLSKIFLTRFKWVFFLTWGFIATWLFKVASFSISYVYLNILPTFVWNDISFALSFAIHCYYWFLRPREMENTFRLSRKNKLSVRVCLSFVVFSCVLKWNEIPNIHKCAALMNHPEYSRPNIPQFS